MKDLKIVFNAATASHDEVVDTIADLFKIGITVENALDDGFQLSDVLTAIQLEPVVKEVVNDFPVFLAEFRKLSGSTAIMAVQLAKERTENEFGDIGRIGRFAYGFLNETAQTFSFMESTVVEGYKQLTAWKNLFATLEEPAV